MKKLFCFLSVMSIIGIIGYALMSIYYFVRIRPVIDIFPKGLALGAFVRKRKAAGMS